MARRKFRNGVVRVPLRTPICVHPAPAARRLCLESVLAGQLYERFGDGPGAVKAVMTEYLDCWQPDPDTAIPNASQAIFKAPIVSRSTVPFTRSIFRVLNDPGMRASIAGVKWENAMDTLSRHHKAEALPPAYDAIEVDSLYYLFCGDVDRIANAFRRAGSIGALRAKGGGEIDSHHVTADVVPSDSPMFGIVCGGRLMRPVPTRYRRALDSADAVYHSGLVEAWRMPFHDPVNRELCLVPVQTGREMVLDAKDIGSLLR